MKKLIQLLQRGRAGVKVYRERMKDPKTRPLYLWGAYILVGLGGYLILSMTYKTVHYFITAHRLASEIEEGPRVKTVKATVSADERVVTLLGESRPFLEVTLYAKVSGYLKVLNVDKGDWVKKDQTLAVVSSPETGSQFDGALADARNKRTIANRMKPLLAKNLVSVQEAQQAFSDADIAEAKQQQAGALKGYQVLTAPFDGQITARFTDPGALVQNAMNSQTSAQPVVTVSDVEHLRIYVYLDQKDAYYVKVGFPVEITVAERPDFKMTATVTRFSGQLDTKTRTLLTEVDVDNSKHDLVPGSLVYVSLKIKSPPYVTVPAEALTLHNNKPSVTVVNDKGIINYRPIEVADDDGVQIMVLSGLKEGERVALNLGNTVEEGSHIRVVDPSKPGT